MAVLPARYWTVLPLALLLSRMHLLSRTITESPSSLPGILTALQPSLALLEAQSALSWKRAATFSWIISRTTIHLPLGCTSQSVSEDTRVWLAGNVGSRLATDSNVKLWLSFHGGSQHVRSMRYQPSMIAKNMPLLWRIRRCSTFLRVPSVFV